MPTFKTPYMDAVLAIRDYYAGTSGAGDIWLKVQQGTPLTQKELNALKQVPGINYSVTNSGKVGGLSFDYPFESVPNTGASINSNVPNASYGAATKSGKFRVPANYDINNLSGKHEITSGAKKVSTGTRVATAAGKVTTAIAAVGVGMQLGKLIDETLYNVGDFFGLNPPETLNPQSWDNIATTEEGKSVIDALFGIDGDTSTMYLPEELMGYMFNYWLAQGAWAASTPTLEINTSAEYYNNRYYANPFPLAKTLHIERPGDSNIDISVTGDAYIINAHYPYAGTRERDEVIIVGNEPFTYVCTVDGTSNPFGSVQPITNHGTTYYVTSSVGSFGTRSNSHSYPTTTVYNSDVGLSSGKWDIGYIIYTGTIQESGGIDGVEEDPDAGSHVNPTLIDSSTPETATQSLKQQYPQLFDNSIERGLPDPDTGDVVKKRYVPVPWPNLSNPTKPQTGSQNQSKPDVDPSDSTEDATETMTDTLIGPDTGVPTPPTGGTTPPDTGTGDSPTGVPPTGSASSLWAIYNPTQAEIDSFGSWLWSSNLVDQIKKLFSDPMQAIIGVHKVFASPSTGAAQNIKVGYLDSGVSAAVVTDQYTTVDCGSVSLREYYGSVLDYSPFTEVSLYLPFIGIVRLDTADVMRSSISVKYHVDVLTGACLADVKVTRDGAGGVLYQYAGSAIVTYPVSSGSYVGAVAGVLGIAGGIAGTIASGGALAPALMGGAMGATHLHTDVQHSGGFSGSAGAMGAKKPYLIISRAQGATPNLSTIKGVPATKRITLGSCDGYTKVDQLDLDGIPATSRELSEIETLLKQGVIL